MMPPGPAAAMRAAVGPARRQRDVPAFWPNRESSRVVRAGGRCWHLQRAGQGRPLMLLHGTGASTHSFRDLLPALAAHFDVLAPDLPGHGFSERLAGEALSLPRLATALRRLLDALRFRPAIAVGHSAGAAILARMSLDRAIEPATLVGLNAALLPPGGAGRRLFLPAARLAASTRVAPWLITRQARNEDAIRRLLEGTGSLIDGRGVALYQRLFTDRDHVAAVLSMMANWNIESLAGELGSLEAELVLVTAAGDRAVDPSEALAVRDRVPGCRVVALGDGGHLVHEEDPAGIAAVIREAAGQGAAGEGR